MNLTYATAEYFIKTLEKSSNFSIRYEYLIPIIDQASNDVASYLKEGCKKDLLFIFKKFPDVFVCNKESVTLTDAFLSLYAFPSSTNFSTHYKCFNAFEIDVIEYFKLILSRCGTCHYFQLFNLLLTQNGQELASYFFHYKRNDMYKFFQTHANTFSILNDNVYLRENPSLDVKPSYLDHKTASNSMRKLTKSTYFLLTCFESLHYIELRQCISFVLSVVRQYLNGHSLLKQRELFENLPETFMDQCGFLSLKNFSVSVPKSRKVRLLLLMVCLLAFEREMHFQKLVQEVKNRTSFDVNSSLCDLSVSDQFRYFKDFSEFFEIRTDGYLRLLSSFIFPLCSFENSSLNANIQNFQNSKSVCSAKLQKMSLNSSVASNLETRSQNIDAKCREMSENVAVDSNVPIQTLNSVGERKQTNQNLPVASNIQTSFSSFGRKITKNISVENGMQMQSIDSTCTNLPVASIVQTKSSNSLSHQQRRNLNSDLETVDQRHINLTTFTNSLTRFAVSPTILNKRLKFSILYLLQCFVPPSRKSVLKSLLHVLRDVKDVFVNLPLAVQNAFMKEFYAFIKVESGKKILNDIPLLDIKNEEKVAMVIAYIIIKEGKIHFLRLADILIYSKVDCVLSSYSASGQFKYFKAFNEYFNMSGSGYITLNDSFNCINEIVDYHVSFLDNSHVTKILPEDKQLDASSKCVKSKHLHNSTGVDFGVASNNCNMTKTTAKSSNEISLKPVKEISSNALLDNEIKVPVVIYKSLQNAVLHLHSFFNPLVTKHVLETVLHALIDVQTFLNNLSAKDQHKFIETYFQFINKDLSLEISPDTSVTLTEKEKIILFVTYLLIKEKSLHFEKIIKRLINFNVKYAVCAMKVSKQFSYFKTLTNHFVIDGTGYVCLSSSFYSLRSIISSLSASIPQSKANFQIQIKNSSLICSEKTKASSTFTLNPAQNIITTGDFNKCNTATSFKKEVTVNSSKLNEELVSMVTDYCFSILTVCKKMKIVNLCQRVNTCHIKCLQNYFSFFTVSEKVNFFRKLSQYFDISKDDFVSLKAGVKTSYISKSDLTPIRSRAVSESAVSNGYSSNNESVNSYNISELSETPSFMSGTSFTKTKSRTRRKLKLRKRLNKLTSKQTGQNSHDVPELQSEEKQKLFSKSEFNSVPPICNDSFNKSKNTLKSSSISCESNEHIKTVLCDKVIENRNPTVAIQNSDENAKTSLCVKDSFQTFDKIPANMPLRKISKVIKQKRQNSHNVLELQSDKQKSISKSESSPISPICNGSFNKSENTLISSSISCESNDYIKTVLSDQVIENRNPIVAAQNSDENAKTNLYVKDSFKILGPSDTPLGKISKDIIVPRQPSENLKISSLQNKSEETFSRSSNCIKSSNGGLHIKINPEFGTIGSLESKVSDSTFNLQSNEHSEKSKNHSDVLIEGTSLSALSHNFDSKDVHDNSFESYGTELLNSFLGELEFNLTSSDNPDPVTKHEKNQIFDKHYSSNFSDLKVHSKNAHVVNTVCDTLKTIPEPSALFSSESRKCYSKEKCSNLSKTSFHVSGNNMIAMRAVNFFCTILGKYEIGVSADFLIKHLNLASSEVQLFMFRDFQKDPLSFFLEHKEVFYVSPQTNNIYLVQNFYHKA